MRKIIASSIALVAFAASSVTAGTLTEPEVEETVEEAAASSSSGLLIPLLLLLVVGAAIASSDSDEPMSVPAG